MNLTSLLRDTAASFLGRLLCTGLLVCGLGMVSEPAFAAGTAVTIDTSPLIVQPTLAPDIMLMLDDSGSMAWDFMPDYSYLKDSSNDGIRDTVVNGVYYNPSLTYSPPPKANGTSYYNASPDIVNAYNDGFLDSTAVDVRSYSSPSTSNFNYYTTLTLSTNKSYASTCSSGYTLTSGTPTYTCISNTTSTPTCSAGYTLTSGTTYTCTGGAAYTPTCPSGYALTKSGGAYNCTKSGKTNQTPTCPQGGSLNSDQSLCQYSPQTPTCAAGTSLNSNQSQCQATQTPTCPSTSGGSLSSNQSLCNATQLNYFTYTTGVSGGPYTRHYVGASGDCSYLSTTNKAVCQDDATTRQNVANWFSYYRTRILMAKSGLMTAFSGIDPTYRIGFGSINNRNTTDLNATGHTASFNSDTIAQVQPFGNGAASTQRAYFWTWVNDITPNNSTPLRVALDAVGQYYKSDQPWQTDTTTAGSGELACRASYTILTTDGFWNESDSLLSGVGDVDGVTGPTVTGPNSQSYAYQPVLPYADSGSVNSTTSTSTYAATGVCPTNYSWSTSQQTCTRSNHPNTSPTSYKCSGSDTLNGTTCTKTTTTPGTTYSNTLADVAMKYWENDLRPSTANEVPTNNEDPAFWQHMTTFTLGLGFTPLYSDQATPIPVDQVFKWANGQTSQAISGFVWPQPTNANNGSINNIADLAHAAVNGHGGFYSATSPQAFSSGLKDALNRASQRVGTGASLAANSTQLQTGTVAYQANYYTVKWKGDLKALSINSTTGAISTTATWVASNMLPAAASRTIYTYNPSAKTYLAFQVSGTTLPALSSAQLSALGSSTTTQTNMINYLRGDSTNEQTNSGAYRNRDTPIGDIVSSQPVYVGAPSSNQFYGETFYGSSAYATYANNKASRTGLIYVAANDGYLHAFNASSGAEAYAYLPGAVITSNLTNLSDPNYGTTSQPHQYFNDGEVTVADVYMSGAWKTVLVGTTGRGLAMAVYALDITDPANIQFLWERSAGDGLNNSNYIGQMTGKPVIAQTSDDSATGGTSTWTVLMGNGYNSAAGAAALLQFNLADGTLTVHTTTDTTGLAAPAVWMDPAANGVSSIAYAGDADGNLWSFVLNTGTGATTATPSSTGTKLFTATDASGNAQPITAGMLVGKDSQTGNVWAFFGTGKYLTSTDLTNTSTQTWYGVIVKSSTTANPAIGSQTNKTRASLVQRYITAETSGTSTSQPARTVTTASAATSMTGYSGWYIDLLQPSGSGTSTTYTQQGERMVTPNQFQGNLLLGTTRIPQATDPCDPSGKGWVMAVDPFTGTNPQSSFFDLNGDGSINSSDTVNGVPAAGIGFSSLPNNPIFVGGTMLMSFDNGTNSSITTSGSSNQTKRVSWRELINQ